MCGIFGCICDCNAYDEVLRGLELLQYRGYDSCGIAFYEDCFKIEKAVGTLKNLPKKTTDASIVFGHTRWATNGVVNETNAHPHVSFDGKITIVHNGIIKNADLIKNQLIKRGITFYSQTDTEVIANYIAYNIQNESIEHVLKNLFKDMEGSFSLIVGTSSGVLYLVKQFSPLNVVKTKEAIYISSDISSLASGELYSLKDGDIIKIESKTIAKLNDKNFVFENHENTLYSLSHNNYKHFMLKEIYETPFAIQNTYFSIKDNACSNIVKKYNKLTLLGCGTAYHSCLIGEYLLKNECKKDVESFLASNYEIKSEVSKKHLHIIVSQSGETADCIKIAQEILKHGGEILLITNESKSSLAQMCKYKIFTNAEKEIAVASTKTYCCQVFVFAYLCHKLVNENYTIEIHDFIYVLRKYISSIKIVDIAEQLKNYDKMILLASGIDYLTILEASLKIREIDYVYTLPMYAAELKHGTLSLIDENAVVLTLDSCKNNQKIQTAVNEIESRNGKVVNMNQDIGNQIDTFFKPIFTIIPFQLLSYQIAVLNNRNPDMPRNLAKSVTVE